MANSLLSKIKIGEVIYDLKDVQARQDLATLLGGKAAAALGTAAFLNSVTTIAEGGSNLPTEAAVHAAIQTAVSGLSGAMHFKGVLAVLPTDNSSYTAGDVIIVGHKEYVMVVSGENGETKEWKELGDESIYLTTELAGQTYVAKTRQICGITLENDITADQIKEKLGLKALAYKESASQTLTDYATGIGAATYTPAGSINVELTSTATDVTSTGTFTPAGTLSTSNVTVTPETTTFKKVTNAGSLPSLTESKGAFATAGLVAALDATDTEMLVFSDAGTAQALVGTTFDQGALPTLEETATTVVTGIATAVAAAQTFTGTAGNISVTGSYDKTGLDTTKTKFTGTAATIAPTLTKGTKVITVE